MSDFKGTPGPWEYGGEATICTTFDREVNIFPPHHSKTGGYQYGGPVAVVAIGESGEANARLIAAAPDLYELAKAYEQWEADVVMSQEAWNGGMSTFPTLTQKLYDRLIEIQTMRNAAIRKATGPAPA